MTIDKQSLYGRYNESEDWRTKLHKKLAHKSLDIPLDDDMNINQTKTGMTWKELAIIAAAGIGGGYVYTNERDADPPVVQQPVDSEYEIRFYDSSGNLIDIPKLPSGNPDDRP
jgi:hypothetical protein